MSFNRYNWQMAVHDFQSARQKAALQEVLARLTGKSTQLLSYEDVAEKLKLRVRVEKGIQQVPLDAIVGSVGRYTDFTRTFLPRRSGDQERWARVKTALSGEGVGLPPVELYKVGGAYFVIDGNHRISIARQDGTPSIEARVIEVQTPVPLTPDVQPDDLIIKAEYADFLEATRIMELRPNVDLSVTVPGQYEKLLEQICVEECVLDKDDAGNMFEEAVTTWYDNVYTPLAETIRDRGLLRWFPDRTITDLYVWISENRSTLEKELGWEIRSDSAATDLILERSARAEPGGWRKARTVSRYTDKLFMDILVPLSGSDVGWQALEQAIIIAQREDARIHGLHIAETADKTTEPAASSVQDEFDQRCRKAGIEGKLAIESGNIATKIKERATLSDLIVLNIAHPPKGGLSTLRSPFRIIILNSSRPLLAVPKNASQLKRALLAYDGSPRAKEALFVAAYLAEMWKTELIVFTGLQGKKVSAEVQDEVRRYLDIHEVEAEYVVHPKYSPEALGMTAEERQAELILMGGYGRYALKKIVIGSSLDAMLRESNVPVFICR